MAYSDCEEFSFEHGVTITFMIRQKLLRVNFVKIQESEQ